MIYPVFPNENEKIGIFAPSAGVGHKLESFDRSLSAIRACGYEVVESDSVRTDDIRSAEAKVRGEEFNIMTADSDIAMMIAASGGEYNIEMLPYIDWESFARSPKWIMGASDPTNILYTLTTKYDIATLYGCNAGTFDWEPLHEFQTNALDIIGGNIVKQNSFDKYISSRDFEYPPALDAQVRWDVFSNASSGSCDNGGKFVSPTEAPLDVTGRLIGGCLDVIAKLIGTPYDATTDFIERYDDIIWYFDPYAMDAQQLYCTILQMKYAGYFDNARAIIFGRVLFTGGSADADYLDNLSRCLDIPFIWNADIGHVKPCMTLINGAMAHVTCADGKGSIEMSLE